MTCYVGKGMVVQSICTIDVSTVRSYCLRSESQMNIYLI